MGKQLFIADRFLKKLNTRYQILREEKLIQSLAGSYESENVNIKYPFVVEHPELIRIHSNTTILSGARLQPYPELVEDMPHITIGKRCFFCYRLSMLAGADITVGDDVLVASDVSIISHNHGIDPESKEPYMKQKLETAPVSIGDNCWIGDKVIILPGVSIGKGCVIGGGAIVTRDVPDYSIAVGNPARVIKQYDFILHEWKRIK